MAFLPQNTGILLRDAVAQRTLAIRLIKEEK